MNKALSKRQGLKESALRDLAMSRDTNRRGDIFGGWIIS